MKLLYSFVFVLCVLLVPILRAQEVKVGVLGDSHGQDDALKIALNRMRSEGVQHLIVMGDIVPWNMDNLSELESTLRLLQSESGLSRDKIEILIGNAEEDVLGERIPIREEFDKAGLTEEKLQELVETKQMRRREAAKFYNSVPFEQTQGYALLKKYAVVSVKSPGEYSVLDIGGKSIAISHYNNRPLPEDLLQEKDVPMKVIDPKTGEEKTIIKNFRLEHTVDAQRLARPLPAGVDVAFYGDLHIGGAYWDAPMDKVILNPGVLHSKAKDVTEPQAYVIYNTTRNEVTYFDAVSDVALGKLNLDEFARRGRSSCTEYLIRLSRGIPSSQ